MSLRGCLLDDADETALLGDMLLDAPDGFVGKSGGLPLLLVVAVLVVVLLPLV